MGDQRRYFKVWTSALTDPDLDNFSLADGLGRWVRLGLYLTEHGKQGVLVVKPPANALAICLKMDTFEGAISLVKTCPNCTVTTVTMNSVTAYRIAWRNWKKYQGDYSLERVQKHREKKRREREVGTVTNETAPSRERSNRSNRSKNLESTPLPIASANGVPNFEQFYARYPRHKAPGDALKAWRAATKKAKPEVIMAALEQQRPELVARPAIKIPYPASWLNGEEWRNEPEQGSLADDPYKDWPHMYDCAQCGEAHETRECTKNGGAPR